MKSTKSVNSSVSSAIAGEWETPDELFQELDRVYHFTLDACARPENAKCQKFFTKKEDGLAQDWRGNVVYCCPPSGTRNLRLWVAKGAAEGKKKNTTVVMLLPVSTDAASISSLAFGCISCRNELSSPTACCRPMQSMVRTERRTLPVVCGPQWWLCSPARSASSAVNE